MNIGIIGTRGIPNLYGGFEQFAQEFGVRMVAKGHKVSVYTSHNHPVKVPDYQGVQLIRCHDPEHRLGTAGQFLYDFNCIRDARTRHFDLILQLGYTSSTVWSWLYPKEPLLVTNMDGLEWARSKYSKPVQYFLRQAERWGVKYSDHLVADSIGIQRYLQQKYLASSVYVPYGADIYEPDGATPALKEYGLSADQYDLAIARFEPENNLETILKAYARLPTLRLVMVGNYASTAYGRRLEAHYKKCPNVLFTGGIYDLKKLNELRYYGRLYYHGHSVGGTNPSLLEAMGCSSLICAHSNEFNRYVLNDAAFYFTSVEDVHRIAASDVIKSDYHAWISMNKAAIRNTYNWDFVTNQLEDYFTSWYSARR